jgi:hypothetical protein
MREQDMRRRVEQFMHKRLRAMLMPATLGVGLALGGCASDALDAEDAAPDTTSVPIYSAVLPDAGPDVSEPQPDYMAPIKLDAGPQVRYAAQMSDAGDPLPVPIYMAIAPRA